MKVSGFSDGRLWLVAGIVLLNGIGMTIVFPLLPFLIGQTVPRSQVVFAMGALSSVYALCAFLASPVLGAMSDRFGRRIVLMVSLLGSVFGYILLGVGGSFEILLLGRIIDGLTAGNLSTLFASVADSTHPSERTKWYGLVGGAMGLGTMVGPAFGGALGAIALSTPFFVTGGIFLGCAVLVGWRLPETLAPEKRSRALSLRALAGFSGFRRIFTRRGTVQLFAVGGLFAASLEVYQFNFSVMAQDVLGWGPPLIGAMLTVAGVCDVLSRTLVLPALLRHFRERTVGVGGLFVLGTGLGCLVASVATPSLPMVVVAIVLITTGEGLFDPGYNGQLSRLVTEGDQGTLQGVNQSLQAAYRVIVPLGAAALYAVAPILVYVVATAGALAAMFLLVSLPGSGEAPPDPPRASA